ncbi:MAG: sensor histidine kinase [Christensenellales bacterium]
MTSAGEPNGYLCMAMTENGFRKTVASNADDVLITDRFDTVFVGGTHVFTGKFNKLEADVRQANGIKDTPWGLYYISSEACGTYRVYAALPCGDVLRTARFLLLMVLLFFAAMIAAIQISTKRVAQEKTRVIDEIATACDLVSHGNLNTELTISSHDEFQIIAQAYNTMLENVRKSMEKSVKLGRDTAVAQIRQMESQFNPHFLFNTLENIRVYGSARSGCGGCGDGSACAAYALFNQAGGHDRLFEGRSPIH